MRFALLPVAVVLATVAVSGCAVSSPPAAVGESVRADVLSYSNPTLDNMMVALNVGDYGMFSAKFSQAMRGTINMDAFNSMVSNLRSSIGKYVSRDSSADVVEISGYYRVTYTTQFTDDSPVSVILSFKKGDSSHLVEGLYFTSKKLLGRI